MKVLLVEDKENLRFMLAETLRKAGFEIEEAADGRAAIKKLKKNRYLLILTDLKLPHEDGLAVLKAARQADLSTPVVLMTAFGTVDTAVEAMKSGAVDFLTKPVDPDELIRVVEQAAANSRRFAGNLALRELHNQNLDFPTIIGEHSSVKEVVGQIRRIAPTDSTALLLGESGTGKELFARVIHLLSERRTGPLVAINCAAIPETLLESELFGHEKGSFTGASQQRLGKFEVGDGGSIFLDEIGEVSGTVQSKILRVIQEKAFERVGGNETINTDIRIIAASNRNLKKAVADGRFRQDLFYRLAVFPIELPPLRARRSDVLLLADYYLEYFNQTLGKSLTAGDKAREILRAYSWPGNVRELRNCMERAVLLSDGSEIDPETFGLAEVRGDAGGEIDLDGTLHEVSSRASEKAERQKIEEILKDVGGNRAEAAKRLSVSYKTLLHKIRDLEIPVHSSR